MTQSSLLPNGEQQFIDGNGVPYAGGFVYFYIPSTTTPKDTYQNPDLTILNTNPVVLDSAGRAVIYGSGSYRQILKDKHGNTVWDQLTQASNSSTIGTAVTITHANSPYHVGTGVSLLKCDASAGAIVVVMYAASAMILPNLTILKTDTSDNTVSISDGTNTLDAIVTPIISASQINGSRTVESDGTTLSIFGVG